jgi:hypothetical protein
MVCIDRELSAEEVLVYDKEFHNSSSEIGKGYRASTGKTKNMKLFDLSYICERYFVLSSDL